MILRLTDGTSTLNLTGGADGIYRADYAPRGPELSVVEFEPATIMDGGESAAITRRNVAEQCNLVISADTTAEVETALHALETWFMRAIEWQNRRGGSRVWVEYASDDTTIYRSEILYGRVELGENPLMWLQSGPALAVGLIWRRRYYWEGAEETLALANQHGTGTGGVPVFNCLDAVNDNYVHIAGASVTGLLPSPARLELINRSATGVLAKVIVGHNVYADPADLVPVLECEIGASAVGSVQADATCSGLEYLLANLTETRDELLRWTIPSAELSHYRGRFFRLWVRCQAPPLAGTYLQPKMILGVGTGQVVAEGQETLLEKGQVLQDLGVLQIPPYLMGDAANTFYQMDLAIWGRNTYLGTVGLDCLFLVPVDSYRELRPRAYGCDPGIVLVDDGMEDGIWLDGFGAGGDERIGSYYGLGPRVMLVPGLPQRLYFLATDVMGEAGIDLTMDVIVKYRPRRTTI